MIEVTCGACGTALRFAEAGLPPGGKTAICTACKARVQVPGPGAAKKPMLGGPALAAFDSAPSAGDTGDIINLAELPSAKRPSPLAGAGATKPAPRSGLEGAAVPVPTISGLGSARGPAPPSALDLGDINLGLELDEPAAPSTAPIGLPPLAPKPSPTTKAGLGPGVRAGIPPIAPAADLLTPKRAPGATPAHEVPGGKREAADLPAPKRASVAEPSVPVAISQGPTLDLPAPKRAATPVPAAPIASAPTVDLPAPKRAATPAPVAPSVPPALAGVGVTDLPAPKRAAAPSPQRTDPAGITDLPAPKGPPAGITDLPAPKGPPAGITDLPAPKGPPAGITDLPAPKGPSPRAVAAAAPDITDLLTPKGPAGVTDLLAPRQPAGVTDLPAPKRASAGAGASEGFDLPAPKGFFDDLPAPVDEPRAGTDLAPRGFFEEGGTDLPAPKGFFDDLPAPAGGALRGSTDLPAPKGFFDDLPGPTTSASPGDAVAPKGFFDDLPGPTTSASPGNAVAPKGFFDDLPSVSGPRTAAAEVPPPKGFFDDLPSISGARSASTDVAPKGFFDDIPVPAGSLKADTVKPGKPLDLDDLDLAPHSQAGPLPTAPAARAAPPPAAPAAPSPRAVPSLELPEPGGDPFGGLDLPLPSAGRPPAAEAPPSSGIVSFKPADKTAASIGPTGGDRGAGIDLDLESASARQRSAAAPKLPAAKDARDAADAKPKAATAKRALSKRATQILAAAGLAVVLLGAVGFFMYRRWQKQQDQAAQLETALAQAHAALATGTPGHWTAATAAAQGALGLDPGNADALGIAVIGLYAAVLDEGIDAKARGTQADGLLQQLVSSGGQGDAAEKAQALKSIVENQPARALERLAPVLARNPNDADALLFAAWAQLATHAWSAAVPAFDKALAAAPDRPVPALYGRAQAKLALGDRTGARADFDAVLAKQRDHIGAQVGQAAAAPPGELESRESQLVGLLQRSKEDLAKADPRALVRAWVLAGDAARQAGRVDAAAERYKKALELAPDDLGAVLGQAQVLARTGALEPAAEAAARVLARAPDNVDAALVAAEIALDRKRPDDAQALVDALVRRTPPVETPLQKSRLAVLRGRTLATQAGKEEEALTAFEEARGLAIEGDITPTLAAANLLGKMVAAQKDPKSPVAEALRRRADDLLAPLEARAQTDPTMAVTLGVAYLASGSPDRAEKWLAAAVEKRPKDIEALFQLAEAQAAGKKLDLALATRRRAFDLDPSRADIGLSLAREYEDAGRDDDATELYSKLVAPSTASLDARARAGRFWARLRKIDLARAEGDKIRAVDPNNPAGLFLVAEGMLLDKKLDLARRTFQQAIDADPQPPAQYFDALGRADEALADQTEDTRFQEDALRAYTLATKADSKMFNPWAGRARILLARSDWAHAIEALEQAHGVHAGDGDVMFGLGVAHQELGHDQDAVTWLARSVAIKPRAEAYYRLGLIYFDRDQPGQAVAALNAATSLGLADEKGGAAIPWLTEAFFRLGDIEDSRNNLGPAARAWRIYLARNPSNRAQAAEVRQRMKGLPGGP